MFPRFRQQLLARIDLAVELATLGEYGVDEHGSVMTLEPCAETAAVQRSLRVRDRCGDAAQPQRCPTASGYGAPTRS
jgi:hypothetical protein